MRKSHWKEQAATALSLAVVLSLAFYLLDWHQAASFKSGVPYLNYSMAWENRIPCLPSWTWIYFGYFPFLFTPIFLREVRQQIGLFRRAALGFALQYGVAFIFFFLIPVRMERPVPPSGGWSESAMAFLYRIDPGFNIFPSLHVSNCFFVSSLLWRLRGPKLGAPAWIMTGLITTSTLLVKQHYFVDLVVGAILGVAVYRVCFLWRNIIQLTEPPRTGSPPQ